MSTTETTATETVTFEVGSRYQARSIGDYDCVWTFLVLARTAKFITIQDISHGEGDVMRVGVRVFNFSGSRETASPFGRYSMSPLISADTPLGS